MNIQCWQLAVRSLNKSVQFYQHCFGFSLHSQQQRMAELTLGGGQTVLKLVEDETLIEPYTASDQGTYWKIGLTVADLDAMIKHLKNLKVAASPARQFLDVGYLCHVTDPDGYPIELLQFTAIDEPLSLDHKETIQWAHITFRVTDIEQSLSFYSQRLGLFHLETIHIPSYQFDLYFLGSHDESPPISDCINTARHWLWTRPYTLIELQHSKKHTPVNEPSIKRRQMTLGISALGESRQISSPDGIPVTISN